MVRVEAAVLREWGCHRGGSVHRGWEEVQGPRWQRDHLSGRLELVHFVLLISELGLLINLMLLVSDYPINIYIRLDCLLC